MARPKTGRVSAKIAMVVGIAVLGLLAFGPLLSMVTGDSYQGSTVLDLGRGDRVTILTTAPDPSQAPTCTASGPGGANVERGQRGDVFDINGVRFYPTFEFTAGGDGAFEVTCENGALFKTDVTTAGFSFGNLLKGGIPTWVLIGIPVVAIGVFVYLRKRRSSSSADEPAPTADDHPTITSS